MKITRLPIIALGLYSTAAATSCNIDSFTAILERCGLANTSSVLYASSISEGESSFDPSPPYPKNITGLPEMCAVKLEVQSSENSSYRFAIFLPTKWNQRMIATGNGGIGGGVNYIDMGHLSHYGFASLSTDTGHLSTALDSSWIPTAPESLIDWGYRAMHGSVSLGKKVITQYYRSDIKYSYYASCSTGGRQGLKEMQISPESFDGILAGAPAWWSTHLQSWSTWYPLQNYPSGSPSYIPADLFPSIARSIVAQCDPQDGVSDGVSQDPASCKIDYGTLNLTEVQISTLQTLYANWTAPNGTFLFASLTPGALLALADSINPSPVGYSFLANAVVNESSYNFTQFTLSDLALADRVNPGNANADDFGAISKFHAKGGKLILYHGLLDPGIPSGASQYYYNRTLQTLQSTDPMTAASIDDFFRLFLVPNMGHCAGSQPAGSNAPWYFAAGSQNQGPNVTGITSGVPGYEDPEHDMVLALMRWVEEGQAPESIIATKFKGDNSTEVVRQGLVCSWPKLAKWNRVGDVYRAESWTCG